MMGECFLANCCGGLDLRLTCNRIGAGQLALQNGDPAPLTCLGRDPQEGLQPLPFLPPIHLPKSLLLLPCHQLLILLTNTSFLSSSPMALFLTYSPVSPSFSFSSISPMLFFPSTNTLPSFCVPYPTPTSTIADSLCSATLVRPPIAALAPTPAVTRAMP